LNVGRRHRAQIRRFGSIDDRTRLLQLRGREPPLRLDARLQPRRDLAPSVRAGDGGGSSCLLAGIPRRPRQPCAVEPTACQRCFDSVRWSCPRIRGWRSMACNSLGFGCAGRAKATRRSQRSTALGSCLGILGAGITGAPPIPGCRRRVRPGVDRASPGWTWNVSLVENTMYRYKTIISRRMRSRSGAGQL
jgi:hypothetical protein